MTLNRSLDGPETKLIATDYSESPPSAFPEDERDVLESDEWDAVDLAKFLAQPSWAAEIEDVLLNAFSDAPALVRSRFVTSMW